MTFRTTNDLDIRVLADPDNATRIDQALRQFGFATPLVMSLARLRENNAASGRPKDMADLDNLPE